MQAKQALAAIFFGLCVFLFSIVLVFARCFYNNHAGNNKYQWVNMTVSKVAKERSTGHSCQSQKVPYLASQRILLAAFRVTHAPDPFLTLFPLPSELNENPDPALCSYPFWATGRYPFSSSDFLPSLSLLHSGVGFLSYPHQLLRVEHVSVNVLVFDGDTERCPNDLFMA